MTTLSSFGIDAISTYVPKFTLNLEKLARKRKVNPEKYRIGLGLKRMSVAGPQEDSLTMAVEAAHSLFQRYEIEKESVGMLIVGTETPIDAAKPLASYVHRMIELSPWCRTFDTKHACYGGTAALRLAANWCASPSGRGRKALIIMTDIARYDTESPGEPTQGAGAVAMLVSENPSILALDDVPEAVYTYENMDFWRPLYRSKAIVEGQQSINSYLHGLDQTYMQYKEGSGYEWDDYRYLLFHVPFPKIAYKGFKRLFQKEVMRVNGHGTQELNEDFERKVEPGLWANTEVGNIYTGSLYLSLAALLDRAGKDAATRRIGLYSYGSGSCAEFFSGVVQHDPSAWEGRIGLQSTLARRVSLSYEEYQRFRKENELLSQIDSYAPDVLTPWNRHQSVVFCGIRNHERIYGLREGIGDRKSLYEEKDLYQSPIYVVK